MVECGRWITGRGTAAEVGVAVKSELNFSAKRAKVAVRSELSIGTNEGKPGKLREQGQCAWGHARCMANRWASAQQRARWPRAVQASAAAVVGKYMKCSAKMGGMEKAEAEGFEICSGRKN